MKTQEYGLRETEKIVYNIPKEDFNKLCTRLVPRHTKAFSLIKEGVDNQQSFTEIQTVLKDYLPEELLSQQNIKTTCLVVSKRFYLEHMTTI